MKVQFTQEDSHTSSFLGEGEHDVNVMKMTEKLSKKGAQMIEIEFSSANGKSTRDWFMTEDYRQKLYELSLACGIQKEVLFGGDFDTNMLQGKKLKIIRKVSGKRTYTDKDGNLKETNDYENTYIKADGAPADEEIPF